MKLKVILFLILSLTFVSVKAQKKTVKVNDQVTATKGKRGITHLSSPALKFNSKEAGKLNSEGIKHAQEGKFRLARKAFLKAVELEGEHAALYNNLALVEMLSKNYVIAEKYCYKSLKINPNYLDPYLNLIVVLNENKEYNRALDLGNFVIEYLKDKLNKAITYLNIASSYYGLKKYDKTKEAVDSAKELIGDKVYKIHLDLKKNEKKLEKKLKRMK